MSEPARTDLPRRVDVRVGSATNALQPILSAERPLSAGPGQWLSLIVIVGTAIVADQLTKALVSSRLALGDAVAGALARQGAHALIQEARQLAGAGDLA